MWEVLTINFEYYFLTQRHVSLHSWAAITTVQTTIGYTRSVPLCCTFSAETRFKNDIMKVNYE